MADQQTSWSCMTWTSSASQLTHTSLLMATVMTSPSPAAHALSTLKALFAVADGGVTDHVFVDDAILIEKYYVVDTKLGQTYTPLSTIAVSINANPRANHGQLNHWIDFDVDW